MAMAFYSDLFSFRKDHTSLTSFKLLCPSILLYGCLTLPIPISYVVLFSLQGLKRHEIMWFFVHTLEQRQTFPMSYLVEPLKEPGF